MNIIGSQLRIQELTSLYSDHSSVVWHLRVALDVLLRAVLEDLQFVGDLGLSDKDRIGSDRLFSDLATLYSNKPPTVQSRLLQDRFENIYSSYRSWIHFMKSDRALSRWHVTRLPKFCNQLNKPIRRNECVQTLFDEREVFFQIHCLLDLAINAPGTFYHLARAADRISPIARAGPLREHHIADHAVARIVTASAPIWRLLERDIQSIYKLSPQTFEEFVAERLERMGLNVKQTGSTFASDGGVDLIAWPKDGPFPYLLAIQVKATLNKPSDSAIQ